MTNAFLLIRVDDAIAAAAELAADVLKGSRRLRTSVNLVA
jgi:hypothetical protein